MPTHKDVTSYIEEDNALKLNGSGYPDPTAYKAIKHIEKESPEESRFHKVLRLIFFVCEVTGFEIENRITLIDKQTGKIWR